MTSSGKTTAMAVALFVFAAGLRLVHIRAVTDAPIGGVLVQDAAYYHAEALQLLEPGPSRGAVSFMNLGYPYVLAAIYDVLGRRPAAVMCVQAVLGSLTAVLVALAALHVFERRLVAAFAGGLYAAYGPAVFYEGLLLIPAAANALVAAVLFGVIACRAKTSWWPPIVAGLGVGLASLLRAGSLVYVPALAPVVVLASCSWRRGVSRAAAFVGAAAVVVLPVIVTVSLRAGQWVPLTANGGMNFWVGNHRNAEGIYHGADFLSEVGPRSEEAGFLAEARRRTGRNDLDLVQADRFWLREGLRDVHDEFGRWLRIEGRKVALFWNRHETRTNVGMEFLAHFSGILRLLPAFGFLAVLGLAGLAWLLAARHLWPALVISAFALVPMAVCLLFFVSGEYRHPVAPALCLAAAAPLDAVLRARSQASRAPLAIALIVGALSVPLVIHRFPPLERTDHPRLDYARYATALCKGGAPAFPRALDLLDRGRKRLGDDPFLLDATLRVHVIAALTLDDRQHARAALETAGWLLAWVSGREADDYPARFLQVTFTDLERGVAALLGLPSVRSDPELTRTAALLGGDGFAEADLLIRRGDIDGAMEFLRTALAGAPRSARALMAMGRLLRIRGNDAEAAAWFRRALYGWPRIPEPAVEIARFLASRGEVPGARLALEEALRRQPGNAPALEMLATLPGP
jgi:tetratricopeptide (TPR) repeat protein